MSAETDNIERTSYRNKTLRWFLVLSLILHIICLMSFGLLTGFRFLDVAPAEIIKDDDIVFELAETPVESNTDAAPEDARLVSDKNMKAQNVRKTPDQGEEPFNPGNSEFPETPTPPSAEERSLREKVEGEENREDEALSNEVARNSDEDAFIPAPTRKFSREALLGRNSSSKSSKADPGFENKEFSVDDLGAFAFNTYNWNFAPYMLYLKQRIEEHIFPPPAFTRMGIIDGRFVLRFTIGRDGSMQGIEVIDVNGHKSLLTTSQNAIEGSSPFKPLPSDFPEEFLEVTGTFVYTVDR